MKKVIIKINGISVDNHFIAKELLKNYKVSKFHTVKGKNGAKSYEFKFKGTQSEISGMIQDFEESGFTAEINN